ncbi:vomeronasal type-1 receptor 4-like [Ursus americanus]|uniref:vomeronasal type-1 receptor 4-like n=1 Tax=Ursus americanus TaxID=9643 RepID=UPI001E67D36E|nr:vomeronasal type-1 receptor 4-like [Ursus americanus]
MTRLKTAAPESMRTILEQGAQEHGSAHGNQGRWAVLEAWDRDEPALELCKSVSKYKRQMNVIASSDTILGLFVLSQIGIGFIGNTLLLVLLINTFLVQLHTKPINLVFIHLILANVMTILFSGIPEAMNAFGVRNFLDDIVCKVVMYLYRVTRGLSLCTTSFLSIVQAISITPSNSRWAWLKQKLSTYIFPAFFSFWITNMLIYIRVIISALAPYNTTELDKFYSLTYCIGKDPDYIQSSVFRWCMFLRDFLCVFLMVWASVYMVTFLFKHSKTVQHLHKTSLCPRPSPETKATHTILALVSCFVFFHWSNCFLTIYVSYKRNVKGLENITVILSHAYPAICPLVLIKNQYKRFFLNCAFAKMRKSSQHTISLNT